MCSCIINKNVLCSFFPPLFTGFLYFLAVIEFYFNFVSFNLRKPDLKLDLRGYKVHFKSLLLFL